MLHDGWFPVHDRKPYVTPDTRARWTGEMRRPCPGEWYLSGAIPEAYFTRVLLADAYPIAELCETKTIIARVCKRVHDRKVA